MDQKEVTRLRIADAEARARQAGERRGERRGRLEGIADKGRAVVANLLKRSVPLSEIAAIAEMSVSVGHHVLLTWPTPATSCRVAGAPHSSVAGRAGAGMIAAFQ